MLDVDHRPLDRPPGRVVARSCCRGAYLRGAFLGGGSLTGPRSPHLEVRTPTPAGASFLRSVGSAEEVRLRVDERASHARAYAKGWEEIEGYLLAAGVVDAVLALEERSVVAEMRAEANRLANADHANLVRTARAAQRQLDAARRLRASGALESLPEPLREAAALRLRHPALSLRELAERASPPATKAGMQRRLAKVVRSRKRDARALANLESLPEDSTVEINRDSRKARGRASSGISCDRGSALADSICRKQQAGWGRSSEDDLLPHCARSETRRRTGSGSTAREREPTGTSMRGGAHSSTCCAR